MLILLIVFILSGLLLVSLAGPMIRRRVPPNALYGLRVPATFADEHVWYEANERTGRDLLWLGAVLVILAVALPLLGLGPVPYALVWGGALVVGTLVLAVVGWRRANRLLRERSS